MISFNNNTVDWPDYMTVKQVAEYLQVSESLIYHLKADGKLDNAVIKVGSSLRFRKEQLIGCFLKKKPRKTD